MYVGLFGAFWCWIWASGTSPGFKQASFIRKQFPIYTCIAHVSSHWVKMGEMTRIQAFPAQAAHDLSRKGTNIPYLLGPYSVPIPSFHMLIMYLQLRKKVNDDKCKFSSIDCLWEILILNKSTFCVCLHSHDIKADTQIMYVRLLCAFWWWVSGTSSSFRQASFISLKKLSQQCGSDRKHLFAMTIGDLSLTVRTDFWHLTSTPVKMNYRPFVSGRHWNVCILSC